MVEYSTISWALCANRNEHYRSMEYRVE